MYTRSVLTVCALAVCSCGPRTPSSTGGGGTPSSGSAADLADNNLSVDGTSQTAASVPGPVECLSASEACRTAQALEQSCRKGDAASCYNLGGFYLEDDNREFNPIRGDAWLYHACKKGSSRACEWLEMRLEDATVATEPEKPEPEPTALSTPEGRTALREFWKPWRACFPLAVKLIEGCVCEMAVGRPYPGVVEAGIVQLHFPLTCGNTGMFYRFQLDDEGAVEKCAVWGEVVRQHGKERLPEDEDWWVAVEN